MVSTTTNVWRNDNLPLLAAARQRPLLPSLADGRQRPLRILVVDEDPLLRWSIAQTLASAGNLVSEATGHVVALRMLADPAPAPDVVLLDYDGDDDAALPAVERIASSARRGRLILMTGAPLVDVMRIAIRIGASAVVQKPFDIETIRALVHDHEQGRTIMNPAAPASDQIFERARAGMMTKAAMSELLPIDRRPAFLAACADIERRYTKACTDTHDACLESGCSLDGEICLEPLLRAGPEYHAACAAEWLKLLVQPLSTTL